MKRTLIFVAVLLNSIYSFGQTNYPNGISGCIGRWNFCSNGTVTSLPDVSGNNNNGATFNLTAAPGFRNVANTAMIFDGSTSYALVPHSANLTPQSISIISLVKFTGWYSGSCQASQIISKGYPYFIPGHYALGVGDNATDYSCAIYTPNAMSADIQLNNLASAIPPAGTFFQLNQWYFYAMTFELNQLKVYIVPMNAANHVPNITPKYNVTVNNGSLGTNTQDLSIGKHLNPTHPYWLNGAMDEVALFNRSLSTAEIQAIYDYLWQVITIAPPPATICAGTGFNLNYTVNTNYFSPGNIFTVQLSDAAGNFSTPVTIGTLASTTSGSIPCTIPSGTPAGSGYQIRIVGSNSPFTAYMETCSGSNITIGASASGTSVTSNSPVCEGSTLNFTVTGISGAAYSWTGPNGFSSNTQNPTISNVTPAAAGTYTLNTTFGSCVIPATNVNVTVNPIPSTPMASNNSPVCAGTSVSLNASPTLPGATYNWTGPNSFSGSGQNINVPNVPTSGAGTYLVTVTQGGCTSQPGGTTVSVDPSPIFNLSNDTTICNNNSFLLQPYNFTSSSATYLWSTAATSNAISVTGGGSYWLQITDNGCSSADTIQVSFAATPVVQLGNDTGFCEGVSYIIANRAPISGSPSYLWNNSSTSPSLSVNQAGSYWLRITNQGCTGADTIELITIPIPDVSIGNDTFLCDGTPITLSSSPQPPTAKYSWSNGSHSPTTTVSQSGTYSLAVSVDGCTGSDVINVSEIRRPTIDLGGDTVLCIGELLTLPRIISSGSEYAFVWSDGSTRPTFTVDKKGIYSVTLSNICGKAYDTINVDYKVCSIWFPSGFTPNGDNLNSVARAKGNLEGISHFRLSIFNRWGNKVFYTEDKYSGWDGTYKGTLQSNGTYMYMIRFDYDGIPQIMKGDITLIR